MQAFDPEVRSMEWFAANDYELGRLVFQRMLAVIYLVGFLSALNQFRALLGTTGLLPIPDFVSRVSFRQSPSIFHWRYSDRLFAAVAMLGLALSAATVAGATDWLPLPLALLVW